MPAAEDQPDERRRVELAEDDARGALVHAGHGPAAAADVEQRHRDEVDRVARRSSHMSIAGGQQREEVVVREHHALGPSGRAARVELERDVVGPPARHRDRPASCSRDPRVVVLVAVIVARRSGDDELEHVVAEVAGDGVEHGHEVGTDDEHLGLAVVDDVRDLGRGEPPVDVDAHGVAERGAEDHLEVLDAVLVEERDAVLRPDAGGREARRPPDRPARRARPTSPRRSPSTSDTASGRSAACVRRMSANVLIPMRGKRYLTSVTAPG